MSRSLCTRARSSESSAATARAVALIDSGWVGGRERRAAHPVPSSLPLDDRMLSVLPEVTRMTRRGETVVVTGTGNVTAAVISVLARCGIVAEELRVEQASLEDAFVALTGRHGIRPEDNARIGEV
jgi:hypothetical protein